MYAPPRGGAVNVLAERTHAPMYIPPQGGVCMGAWVCKGITHSTTLPPRRRRAMEDPLRLSEYVLDERWMRMRNR
jgi:hypothetical protein